MAIAIDLYHQPRRLTGKVGNEGAKPLLPTEFKPAKRRSAQNRPEFLFGGRRITPQAAGPIYGVVIGREAALRHTLTLPSLRDGPLPLPQGERVLDKCDVRRVFLFHADGVVSCIDMVSFASDP